MRRTILTMVAATALSATASGFTDGQLGMNSVGEITVSVELIPAAPLISITGLSDINFDKTIGDAANATETIVACVYMDSGGTYSVTVEANPLLQDDVAYPYGLSISQDISSAGSFDMDVSSETKNQSGTNFVPSDVAGCNGARSLTIEFEDVGNDDVTDEFQATASVQITVAPD